MPRMRSTSPPKSAWPGVSMMLTRVSPASPAQTTEVHLARMVIPRSRSWGLESMARSTVASLARKTPDWASRRSTSVVLPWSTWAMMAMLRRDMRACGGWAARSGRAGERASYSAPQHKASPGTCLLSWGEEGSGFEGAKPLTFPLLRNGPLPLPLGEEIQPLALRAWSRRGGGA